MAVDEKEIVRLYVEEKKSLPELEKLLGMPRGTIWWYLQKHRVKMRPLRGSVVAGKDYAYVGGDPEGCGCIRCRKARSRGIV